MPGGKEAENLPAVLFFGCFGFVFLQKNILSSV